MRIDVIGIGADGPGGLRPELRERIAAAGFLAGGERHLGWFSTLTCDRLVIQDNLPQLLFELKRRGQTERCVVLASGDPLFYGIGSYLCAMFGSEHLRIEPAVSSMQLAFARAGIPWQTATLASIHGRELRPTLLPLLGKPAIGLFTQDGDGPAAAASFFLRHGLADYRAFVAQNLGAADEKLSGWIALPALAGALFDALNFLILQRAKGSDSFSDAEIQRLRALVPGVPDEAFVRPEGRPEVMTRQEVRSVLVGKLSGHCKPGDTIWDIGAGLGTVAVELAVLQPHVEVIAVERDHERAALARTNRERFGAYNIRVLEGTAPEALLEETAPLRVFIGGSGENLAAILDSIRSRLREGGRLVANFVTLEHLALALARLRQWSWPHEVVEVHIARSDSLAGLTALKPQRGVFVVSADKSGGGANGSLVSGE
jgi:precorrin-6Y C5,15-methyltransferase (decarboxylating)